MGINVKVFDNSITTELGKLLDTTYYCLVIAWHGEMKELCDKYNLNFEEVVTDFNETYNKKHSEFGKKNVIRPTLYAPDKKIGGHCVISNARVLEKYFNSKALELIFKYS